MEELAERAAHAVLEELAGREDFFHLLEDEDLWLEIVRDAKAGILVDWFHDMERKIERLL